MLETIEKVTGEFVGLVWGVPLVVLLVGSGVLFTIYFGSFDGSTSPIAMAKINTSLPAIMNPVNLPTSSNQETRLVDYLFM